jgi:hypothetical protein
MKTRFTAGANRGLEECAYTEKSRRLFSVIYCFAAVTNSNDLLMSLPSFFGVSKVGEPQEPIVVWRWPFRPNFAPNSQK